MKGVISFLVFCAIVVFLIYYFGDGILTYVLEAKVEDHDEFDWGMLVQLLILWALPGLLTILGIIWLIGFLFKIDKKLDD